MAHLSIYRQGERVLSLGLEKNVVRIGRSREADITLPDLSLSRSHCALVKKDGVWFLEDFSKNGILFESDSSPACADGRCRISDKVSYKLSRVYSISLDTSKETGLNEEKTIVLSSAPTQVISIRQKSQKAVVGKAEVQGRWSDGTSFNRIVPAEGLTIGSHKGNDICYESESVSQFHARIDFRNNQFILSDLSSTNGTRLNGVRMNQATVHDKSEIQVGPYALQFHLRKEEILLEPKTSNRLLSLVSQNKQMKTLFTTIEVVAGTQASVVINGETGTGKELVAKAIHDLSRNSDAPFVPLNCAALPKDLVESELFGHEKGAFTGADKLQIGAFEAAHGGTLFLDEIAELDLSIQSKLLRAIEAKEIKRLGSAQTIPVNIRLLTATHKNLLEEVRKQTFREDLFYRLQVVQLEVPPLRDRLDDIDLLVPELFSQLGLKFTIDKKALELLKTYAFPGNVRELKNILQRAVIQYEIRVAKSDRNLEKCLSAEDFLFLKGDGVALLSDEQRAEKTRMMRSLRKHAFVQRYAAKELGIPVSTLNDKIKRYGILLQG